MENYNLKIGAYLDKDTECIESFKSPYILDGDFHDGEYLLETFGDKKDDEYKYYPQPLNPEFTADVLKEKKFKVREISEFSSKIASIDYFISALETLLKANNEMYKFDIDRIVGNMELIKIPHTDGIKDRDWETNL